MRLKIDPSYLDYQHCVCKQGMQVRLELTACRAGGARKIYEYCDLDFLPVFVKICSGYCPSYHRLKALLCSSLSLCLSLSGASFYILYPAGHRHYDNIVLRMHAIVVANLLVPAI